MSCEPLSEEERAKIAPYVTDTYLPVFCLRNLPEEVIAVLFAYYSRSREDLRRNLLKLLADQSLAVEDVLERVSADESALIAAKEKAKDFHEKWVVGYGHGSVAEHAVAHLALEDVSIVASKVIEDTRLAAYTEKSTRYVVFDQHSFVPLDDSLPKELADAYSTMAQELIGAYVKLYEPTVARFRERVPRKEGQPERAYEAALRAQACDVLRYLLPCGVRTNIGMTINGRALEHMLKKMNGAKLREIRELGGRIHTQSSHIIPTLLKYVEPTEHRTTVSERMQDALSHMAFAAENTRRFGRIKKGEVRLIRCDEDALERIAGAIVYEARQAPYIDFAQPGGPLTKPVLEKLFEAYVSGRGKWDGPMRALEHASYTFDVVCDQGAFRDLQRHRMQSQTIPLLTMDEGYELPENAAALGLEAEMSALIERAYEVWGKIAREHPEEAQYVIPLAARRRYLVTMNLREAFHMIELRSARQGHASYRYIAQLFWHAINAVHPWAAKHIRVDLESYDLSRA